MDRIISATGCDQIHLAAHRTLSDMSTSNNSAIFYGSCLYPPEDRFSVTDRDTVSKIAGRLKENLI